MTTIAITEQDFKRFQRFIFDAAGITLSPAKQALVGGRLAKRLRERGLDSYGAYLALLASGDAPAEVQTAIDLLTTNETHFFREQKHFDRLRELATAACRRPEPFRVWSAASSSGEEAYSIAMVLSDRLEAGAWEVLGSDISARVLERARLGHYPMDRAAHIPPAYLKRFCRRGIGSQDGTLLIDRALRSRVQFQQVNLNAPLPRLGMFDVVFLRNVMIYFNEATKKQVVARLLEVLKTGGHFFVGHSESLHGISDAVQALAPAIYRKQ